MEAAGVAIPLFLVVVVVAAPCCHGQAQNGDKGQWELLRQSIGISAMHVALLPNDKVVIFDRTDFGASNISLPAGACRKDTSDQALPVDCSAHSVEFDPASRAVRPLTVLTDTWCSSGTISTNGTLVQTRGYNDGDHAVRYFSPCDADALCDWVEQGGGLAVKRWYASNQILPDGRIMVVGGRGQFNYEFIPKAAGGSARSVFDLPFLRETKDARTAENNLYPFVHLSTDGNLFVFANTKAILLDYVNNKVVRRFPDMPGGISRNYPSTGSSVLLPLRITGNSSSVRAEVMVCGGSTRDAYWMSMNGTFPAASSTCGRLVITDASPAWAIEEMPMGRIMGDMVLLPTGDMLVVNGAAKGAAGWGMGREPVLQPVLYRTGAITGETRRFEVLGPSEIPRLYHSTALLLSDGRVLVGGSNPNVKYEFTGVLYPTELSLEAFSPPYLGSKVSRPRITGVKPGTELGYGRRLSVEFQSDDEVADKDLAVTMVAPAFTTHSFSMSQRVLVLAPGQSGPRKDGAGYFYEGVAPASAAIAPPGYYMLFVVHSGVPSRGMWVHLM